MNEKQIIVRFAPSPTGDLHIGGARTAIFNWLFAKKQSGKFLLRIEDTDQKRSTADALEAIFRGLRWLGLEWDDTPIYQSTRSERYRDCVTQLLQQKKAYPSFVREIREGDDEKKSGEEEPAFDLPQVEIERRIRDGERFVVRFHVPDETLKIRDLLHEEITIDGSLLNDFVIQRSDGSALYQLAVVVDDHDMGVTHIIRGDDHLLNTHKQVLIYRAMGWEVPRFAHIPLIHGPDGKRLSKRHGATAVHEYAEQGYLPEAMFNYLSLLGWSPGDDREFFTKDELLQAFSLQGLSKSSAIFDEEKLQWMNAKYIARRDADSLFQLLQDQIVERGLCREADLPAQRQFFCEIIELAKPRVRLLNDFLEFFVYFVNDPQEFDPAGITKHWKNEEVADRLQKLAEAYAALPAWEEAALELTLRDLAAELGVGAGKLIHPCRLALTGKIESPGLFETLAVMGRERVLRRLRFAAARIRGIYAA